MASTIYDVIIVGGGPAGLSAALVLGRSRRRVLVVDDGKPRNHAARTINGYLGWDRIPPREFRAAAHAQIAAYGVELCHDKVTAVSITRQSSNSTCNTEFEIITASGRSARCRKLMLATGVVDELPDIAGVTECYGKSVHHCPYCDGWDHRDQALLAIGSTFKAAAGLALLLHQWSDRVTVLANGLPVDDSFTPRLKHFNISIRTERVAELEHRDGQLIAAIFSDGSREPGDAMFFNTSHQPFGDLAAKLGCQRDRDETATTSEKQRTTVPGVFFAGDADGDVQFVIVAAAEGATAAVTMNHEMNEEDTLFEG